MTYITFTIKSVDWLYTKSNLSYNEAIILQNDESSVYYLWIIK